MARRFGTEDGFTRTLCGILFGAANQTVPYPNFVGQAAPVRRALNAQIGSASDASSTTNPPGMR